jgi:hypothetical protein
MRSLQSGQRPLPCDCATALVDIGRQHPECALSKTGPDEIRHPKAIAADLFHAAKSAESGHKLIH